MNFSRSLSAFALERFSWRFPMKNWFAQCFLPVFLRFPFELDFFYLLALNFPECSSWPVIFIFIYFPPKYENFFFFFAPRKSFAARWKKFARLARIPFDVDISIHTRENWVSEREIINFNFHDRAKKTYVDGQRGFDGTRNNKNVSSSLRHRPQNT